MKGPYAEEEKSKSKPKLKKLSIYKELDIKIFQDTEMWKEATETKDQ